MNQIRIWEYSNWPIPYLDVDGCIFNSEVTKKFTKKLMRQFGFIPLDVHSDILTVAVIYPCIENIRDLQLLTRKMVRVFWSDEHKIINSIKTLSKHNDSDIPIWEEYTDQIQTIKGE